MMDGRDSYNNDCRCNVQHIQTSLLTRASSRCALGPCRSSSKGTVVHTAARKANLHIAVANVPQSFQKTAAVRQYLPVRGNFQDQSITPVHESAGVAHCSLSTCQTKPGPHSELKIYPLRTRRYPQATSILMATLSRTKALFPLITTCPICLDKDILLLGLPQQLLCRLKYSRTPRRRNSRRSDSHLGPFSRRLPFLAMSPYASFGATARSVLTDFGPSTTLHISLTYHTSALCRLENGIIFCRSRQYESVHSQHSTVADPPITYRQI